jgi:hypothetical protein
LVTSESEGDTSLVLSTWRAAGGKADALQIDVDAFVKQKNKSAVSRNRQENAVWPVDAEISYSSARKILRRSVLHYSR